LHHPAPLIPIPVQYFGALLAPMFAGDDLGSAGAESVQEALSINAVAK